jgi:cell division protein FtsB
MENNAMESNPMNSTDDTSAPESQVPTTARGEQHPAVLYLNEHWNLSIHNLISKRKHFPRLVTFYKKVLSLLLRPYANIFIYRQAELNQRMALLSSILWSKTTQLEANANYQRLVTRVQQLEEQVRDIRTGMSERDGAVDQSLDSLQSGVEDSLARMADQVGRDVSALRRELETMKLELPKRMQEQLDNMTHVLLDGLDDEDGEWDEDTEIEGGAEDGDDEV